MTDTATRQGDPALLDDPVAQELLNSRHPAHLAYTWRDGTPRVVPIWFHWTGSAVVMASPANAPKVHALNGGSQVAVTIDSYEFPYKVLYLRGRIAVDDVVGVAPEYAAAARRYFGEEQGAAWIGQLPADMVMRRMTLRPEWVGVLDFQTRLPSAIS
jgi:hypothetical protein